MLRSLRHWWQRKKLLDDHYAYLFAPPSQAGVVSIDCETTGLDANKDEIISLAAVRIVGNQVLTGERLQLTLKTNCVMGEEAIKIHQLRNCDLVDGIEPQEAIAQLLAFIGSSPILGYYLEFDVALINRIIQPWLGIKLPNQQIELSSLYYDQRIGLIPSGKPLDLRLKTICQALNVPDLGVHDAYADALTVGIAYVKLMAEKERVN